MLKKILSIFTLAVLGGCATPPGNMPIGTAPHGVVDLREAKKTVRVYESVPANASDIETITSERCFMSYAQGEPTDEFVTGDLLILAMGKGANGISDLTFVRKGPGRYNCWHRLSGTATIFQTP